MAFAARSTLYGDVFDVESKTPVAKNLAIPVYVLRMAAATAYNSQTAVN